MLTSVKTLRKVISTIATLSVLFFFPLSPVFAAGTLSGTTINNNVLLQCDVCGPTGLSANASILVDNKVNLAVTENTGAAVGVIAGQTAAVAVYTVTNLGNTVQDYGLAAANIASGAVLFGVADNFDAASCIARVESGAVAGYDPTDTATYIDELPPDTSRIVYVVCNIPAGQVAGDQSVISLAATTEQGGAAGTQGSITAETTGAETPTAVDTVFADNAGTDDVARDGKSSARAAYRLGSSVTMTKTVINVRDPYGCNAATGCKLVPGSILTFKIVLTVGGSGNVTGLVLTDPIPANMTYVPGSMVVDGVAKTDAADGDKADFGVTTANTVTISPGTVVAPITTWFTFRATIN